jgi:polyisoprenoid-binding protein YceI
MLLRTLALAVLFAPATALAGPSQVDVKGTMKWVSDAPVEKIVGTADGKGSLTIDFDDLTQISGTVTVAVATMKSGNDKRDGHLRSPEWLDAANHPNITYTIKSVKITEATTGDAVKRATVEATGDFTLHGKTQPLTATVSLKWKGPKVKITTAFNISLDDYAVEGKKGIVGNKVGKQIAVTVKLKGKAN